MFTDFCSKFTFTTLRVFVTVAGWCSTNSEINWASGARPPSRCAVIATSGAYVLIVATFCLAHTAPSASHTIRTSVRSETNLFQKNHYHTDVVSHHTLHQGSDTDYLQVLVPILFLGVLELLLFVYYQVLTV